LTGNCNEKYNEHKVSLHSQWQLLDYYSINNYINKHYITVQWQQTAMKSTEVGIG